MSSYVPDIVLRHARRLSEISRATFGGDDDDHNHDETPAPTGSEETNTSNAVDSAVDSDPELNPNPPQEPVRARALSTSTEDTMVEEARPIPTTGRVDIIDQLLNLASSPKAGPIPEDDGMGIMRARIQAVNACDIPAEEKARLLHEVMLEGFRSSLATSSQDKTIVEDASDHQTWEHSEPAGPVDHLRFWQNQKAGESTAKQTFTLSKSDVAPTYAPMKHPKTASTTPSSSSSTLPDSSPRLGCEHYERNVKLQCSQCHKWYTCRFCHDAREDHALIRTETKNMLCMLCATPQKASDVCVKCGETAASYYCDICKLWENRPNKPIYHCAECGICRRGRGLGKDFFHCKTCSACITESIRTSHKCIERSTDCDCPICGEYMFTSPKPVVFMLCGHSIHKKCFDQYIKNSYKCPICSKSLMNMETHFRNLDLAIQTQPMPSQFRNMRTNILCNDCSGRSTVPFHWLGFKCAICRSYNTVELGMATPNRRSSQSGALLDRIRAAQASASASSAASSQELISTGSRPATSNAGRRRHSSAVLEPLGRVLDRLVRSVSPPSTLMERLYVSDDTDEDSDGDILGLWRLHGELNSDDAGDSEDEEEDEDEDDDDDEEEEDDDDDDENEIMLIGHR